MTTYSDFACEVIRKQAEKPSWRFGQVCFNVLHVLRPDLADQVRASDLDPFHDEKRTDAFLTWCYQRLEADA